MAHAERPRLTRGLSVLIASLFVLLSLWLFDRCLDDDAYISFRYARNLLEGHGLVYNVGERVEGYTNFLWTVLCAGLMALGVPIAFGAQCMGIVCGVVSLLTLERLATRYGATAPFALAAPLALAFTLPFAVEGLLGLEIPLYVCLSLLGLALWAPAVELHSGARSFGCGAVLALSALTRPEGVALFALSFVPDLLGSPRPLLAWREWPWRNFALRALGFLAIFAPHFAWRYAYYGYPLPNTFYAKTGGAAWLYQLGGEYVGSGVARSAPAALLVALVVSRDSWRRALPRYAQLGALWAWFMALYLISVGGDFRHHFRFFVPILAWLLPTAAACAQVWVASFSASSVRHRLSIALLLSFLWPVAAFYEPAMIWVTYREQRNPQLFAVGELMRDYAVPGSLMAISGGGIIPYVSRLPAIEMWGLTDLHIARTPARRLGRGLPGHTKGDGAYILARKPRYILFIALMSTQRPPRPEEIGSRIGGPSELDLWQSKLFHERYALRSFPMPGRRVTSFFELRQER